MRVRISRFCRAQLQVQVTSAECEEGADAGRYCATAGPFCIWDEPSQAKDHFQWGLSDCVALSTRTFIKRSTDNSWKILDRQTKKVDR
jgi:hypothetical protein